MIRCEKKILATTHDTAKGILRKARGVMFTQQIKKPLVFIFDREHTIGLHMMFVFFPIDVIFLTNIKKSTSKNKTSITGTICEIKSALKPWQWYNPTKAASIVIEFSENSIQDHKLAVGKKIIIEEDR